MQPEQLVPFVPILLIFVLAVALKWILRRGHAGKLSSERNALLLSPAERLYLGVLEQILGPEYRIIREVRIAEMIRPLKGFSQSARTSALNRIISKHIDFAVCDPRTMQVVGVIELGRSSQGKTRRHHRDRLVDAALSSAGIPLVRIPAQQPFTPAEIRLRVSRLFAAANRSIWQIQPRLVIRG